MIHRKYIARSGGKEVIVGILGENHIYRPEEADFARKIILDYNVVAAETQGGDMLSNLLYIIPGILFTPEVIYKVIKNRWSGVEMKKITKEEKKDLIQLYDRVSLLKIPPLIGWAALSLLHLPIKISKDIASGNVIERGDPYERGGKYEKLLDQNYNVSRDGLKNRSKCYFMDLKKRDIKIANRSYELIEQQKHPLLINCGLYHMRGVSKNLATRFENFELIEQQTPKYLN